MIETTIKFLLLLILPFILLIRGAVYIHEQYALIGYLTLGAAIAITSLIIFIYFTYIRACITGTLGHFDAIKRRYVLALGLVALYCFYALFLLPDTNVKHKAIQKEYTELHPVLRLAVSTLVLVDEQLIVTDAQRKPEDYRKMGLQSKKRSLHYTQADGFVHAVDIRTKGRSETRNMLVENYFKLMGFNTLRHTGTADHLHISLMSHTHPRAI